MKALRVIIFVLICLAFPMFFVIGNAAHRLHEFMGYVPLFIPVWIVALIVGIRMLPKKQPKPVEPAKVQQPTVRVTDHRNIFLIFNGRGEPIVMGNPFRGILVVGGAGSGKSESVVRQLMENATMKSWCGLLYDFKYPTLTNELQGWLFKHGHQGRHRSINFSDPTRSARVNPLNPKYVRNSSYAREFALSIIQNLIPESVEKMDFWSRSCTDLLTAEIHFLAQEFPQYSTLPHVVALNYLDEDKLIPLLSTNPECSGMVKGLETALRNKAQNQLSGVIATLQSALSRINTPDVFWLLSGDDFSLNLNDPADPKWLSIGNVPDLADTYAPIISLVMTVALKQMNQQGKHPSIVILDEAPTVFIPHVERIPATARSNKVAFAYCAQDMSQIEKAYGRVSMEAIIGNLNNQFYGRLSSPKTAEHVSKMFGKDDFLYESYSNNESSSTNGSSVGSSTSQSYRERDRVRPQQLLQFDPGTFACFLVESDKKEFISRLQRREYITMDMPPVYDQIDFKGNFKAIYDDVRGILTTAQKTA